MVGLFSITIFTDRAETSYNTIVSNIFLFTGDNSFLLRQERSRWIGEFVNKYGADTCVRLDGSRLSVRDLLDDVSVMPFLAEKRLVLVDGVPKASKEEIQALAAQVHPNVILLFIAPSLDKRTASAKELLNIAEVKEFKVLARPALASWMQSFTKAKGVTLLPDAAALLLEFLGDDQDLIAQELSVLALASKGTIDKNLVDLMTIPTDEGIIWKISDLLSAGSRHEALHYAKRMLDRGGDAYGLWAILLNMLKNLVAVQAAVEAGHRSGKELADASGVHIFALRSIQPHAQRVSQSSLQSFVSWAATADKDLKTGAYRSTDEAPEELRALIDRFILKCP